MKRVLTVFVCIFLICIQSDAYELNCQKYYKYSHDTNRCELLQLDKAELKSLSKVEQDNYNKIKKAYEYIKKGRALGVNKGADKYYIKALKYDNTSTIAIQNLLTYYYYQKDYIKVLENTPLIEVLPADYDYLPSIYSLVALSYFKQNIYDYAYNYANKYFSLDQSKYYPQQQIDKEIMYLVLANSTFNLYGKSRTDDILKYINNYINSNYTSRQYNAHLLRYLVYYSFKNNKKEAMKEALILKPIDISNGNTLTAYVRIAECQENTNDELKVLYDALGYAKNFEETIKIAAKIARLEQDRIDNYARNLKIYVKVPNWYDFFDNIGRYVPIESIPNFQDKFFKTANACMNNYKGQDSVACFNQMNNDNDKLIYNLREAAFQNQMLANQQEIIRQQAILNSYERMNYIKSNQPKTYRVNNIGNTFYVNEY